MGEDEEENRMDVSGDVTFKGRMQLLFNWTDGYPETDHWVLFKGAKSLNMEISNAVSGTFEVSDIYYETPTNITVAVGLMTY
ncbi:hypothetical protein PTM75_15200, partial [Clostridium perfringens]|nr:hypothetical protein [Clostridium perfringens]